MNQTTRTNIIFVSGVLIALGSSAVELWLFVTVVQSGSINALKAIVTAVNGAIVFGSIRMLLTAWRSHFIGPPLPLPPKRLLECHSNRLQLVNQSQVSPPYSIPATNRQLITQYLILLEGLLQNKLGHHHYELSIFCDAHLPDIIAYFDSNSHTTPRSYSKRMENPFYYVENNYEVVELLRNPSTTTQFIENTHAETEDYSFTSEEQKSKVRSSLIHCIDVRIPAAIVITCDKTKVLEPQSDFKEVFLSVYFGIATDLYLGLLMQSVRPAD